MEKFFAGLIAWAILCVAAFLTCSLAASFINLEWQWAGASPLSRFSLVFLFGWIGTVIVKVGVEK